MNLGWEVPRELLARQVNRPALFRSTEGMVRVDDRPTTSSDLNKHKFRLPVVARNYFLFDRILHRELGAIFLLRVKIKADIYNYDF